MNIGCQAGGFSIPHYRQYFLVGAQTDTLQGIKQNMQKQNQTIMNKQFNSVRGLTKMVLLLLLFFMDISCNQKNQKEEAKPVVPDYFLLHPKLETTYGYSQAVRIGNLIKISGVVSIDDTGSPTAEGDFLQQMKNCYLDIDKVLKHYGCTFDDIVVENLYKTSMDDLHKMLHTVTKFTKSIFLPEVGLASKNLDYHK